MLSIQQKKIELKIRFFFFFFLFFRIFEKNFEGSLCFDDWIWFVLFVWDDVCIVSNHRQWREFVKKCFPILYVRCHRFETDQEALETVLKGLISFKPLKKVASVCDQHVHSVVQEKLWSRGLWHFFQNAQAADLATTCRWTTAAAIIQGIQTLKGNIIQYKLHYVEHIPSTKTPRKLYVHSRVFRNIITGYPSTGIEIEANLRLFVPIVFVPRARSSQTIRPLNIGTVCWSVIRVPLVRI